MKNIQTYNKFFEHKKYDPKSMLVGNKYYITEPVYDDYEEGLEPETDLVEVIKKSKSYLILRNVEDNFTYERTFDHLLTCDIKEY